MSYTLQKSYVDKIFEDFYKELEVSEDLAFTYYILGTLFSDLDMYNIDDNLIVDGSGDKQIDVVYINEKDKVINIIQVKKSNKGFSSNTVIQIGNGLKWFFKSEEEINNLSNIKLKEKILEAREIKDWDNMKINVMYCNLADSTVLSDELKDEINSINKEYKSVYKGFNFTIVGAQELYTKIKSSEKNEINDEIIGYDVNSVIKLDLDDKTKSIILKIPTIKVAELVQEYGDDLFEQNIRFSLGVNKVNKKIYETAAEKSNLFWFFNNGITIICDSFTEVNHPSKPSLKIKNLQIVNGCQTSTTLHQAFIDSELKESYVLVKIYSSTDTDFINKITEATNSQTSINSRDLASNEKYQVLIDDNFRKKGFYYERKRNQYKGIKIDINKRINNEKLGQAVFSIILRRPSKARINKSAIFSSEFYEKIYDRNIEQLLLAYLMLDFSENKKKAIKVNEDITTQIITYGTFHIARIMGELFFDDGVFSNDTIELKKYNEDILKNNTFLDKYYADALDILNKVVNDENKREEIYSYTNFFKRADTEKLINIEMKK